jgi:polyferredoxin
LRSLKYLVLSFFAYAVIGMSAASIAEFLNSPYALIVDVRMLNFFHHIGETAAWVVLGLVIASIVAQSFWCRYLCPYGGFLGLVSLLSPIRIARNASTRIDCAKCAQACPSALPSTNCYRSGRPSAPDVWSV